MLHGIISPQLWSNRNPAFQAVNGGSYTPSVSPTKYISAYIHSDRVIGGQALRQYMVPADRAPAVVYVICHGRRMPY